MGGKAGWHINIRTNKWKISEFKLKSNNYAIPKVCILRGGGGGGVGGGRGVVTFNIKNNLKFEKI